MFDFKSECGECGNFIPFHHQGPARTEATPIARVVCNQCQTVNYIRLNVSDSSYTLRSDTRAKRLAILDIFAEQDPPLTVRGVFYAMTVAGVVPKSENGYRQVQYQLKEMRLDGSIPYGWIADNTRWQIKPTTDRGPQAALERMRRYYRRDLWAEQNVYVEVWVEKAALAGVMSRVTREFDVPLQVARGYSSMTFIYEAAEGIKATGKPAFVYHFGDHDLYGVEAAEKVREGLREHGAEIRFERMAITEAQIRQYNLPTRPAKGRGKRKDDWGDKPTVELDALPAPILRSLVRECITRHINQDVWRDLQLIEQQERATLDNIISNWPVVADYFGANGQSPFGVMSPRVEAT